MIFHDFLSPLAMDFAFNEGIGLKMLVFAGRSELLSQLGRALDAECRMQSLQCRVQSLQCRLQSLQCRVQSLQCRLQSLQCRVQSAECRVSRAPVQSAESPLIREKSGKNYIFGRKSKGGPLKSRIFAIFRIRKSIENPEISEIAISLDS